MALDWAKAPQTPLVVGGKRLEYSCFGPSPDQAPTLVMLHEGLGCVALWREMPERLAKETGMGVFVYSRQGYGQSDAADLPRSLNFMTQEATEVLPDVLSQIGFQRGILLGHSDGATIAAIYAGSVIDHRVRGLVLIAPHFFTEEMGLAAIRATAEEFDSGDLASRMAKYHSNPENAFQSWAGAWLDPGFKSWNVADVIDYWRIPALAIQGRDDEYGTLAQIQEIEDRTYSPVDTLIVDHCGHAPHFERPELVTPEIVQFSERLARIEAAEVETA